MAVGLAFAASVLAANRQPTRAGAKDESLEESLTPQIGWDNGIIQKYTIVTKRL